MSFLNKTKGKALVDDFTSTSKTETSWFADESHKKYGLITGGVLATMIGMGGSKPLSKVFNTEWWRSVIHGSPLNLDWSLIDFINPQNIISYPIFVAAIGGISFGIFWKINRSLFARGGSNDFNEHGDARFTTRKELMKEYKAIPDRDYEFDGDGGWPVAHVLFDNKHGVELAKKMGIKRADRQFINPSTLGFSKEVGENVPGAFFIDPDTSNETVIGMTRSGKGETDVNQTVDIISRAKKKHSMMINDPKGELYQMAYKTLRKRGYNVQVLNLLDMERSMSYNPLQIAINYARRGYIDEAKQEITLISGAVFSDAIESASDPFWGNSSKNLLNAIILGMIDIAKRNEARIREQAADAGQEPSKEDIDEAWNRINLNNAAAMISLLGGQTVTRDKEQISKLSDFFKTFNELPDDRLRKEALKAFNQSLLAGEKTMGTIYSSALEGLNLYSFVDKITARNSLDLTALGFPRRFEVKLDPKFYKNKTFTITFKDMDENILEKLEWTADPMGYMTMPIKTHLPDEFSVEIELLDELGNKIVDSSLKDIVSFTARKVYAKEIINGDITIKKDEYDGKPILSSIKINENIGDLSLKNSKLSEISFNYSERPSALFLVTPPHKKEFSRLGSFIVDQIFKTNYGMGLLAPGRKLYNRIYFILDEFANLPMVPDISTKVSIGLGVGLLFKFVVQNFEQFSQVYDDETKATILSNSSIINYILTNSDETSKLISGMAGDKTILVETNSYTRGTIDQENVSQQKMAQPLLSPNQLQNFIGGESLIIRSTHRLDNKKQNVRPNPIYNSGSYRMPFRFMFMEKTFDQSTTMNQIPVENPYQNITNEEFDENFDKQYILIKEEAKRYKTENGLEPQEDKTSTSKPRTTREDKIRQLAEENFYKNQKLKEQEKPLSIFPAEMINSDAFMKVIQELSKPNSGIPEELRTSFKSQIIVDPQLNKIKLTPKGFNWWNTHFYHDILKKELTLNGYEHLLDLLESTDIPVNI